MTRRNRIDPWGDLHAVPARGLFTGNRGCVVDAHEQVVRHHAGTLWIICLTRFRDWRWPLARPGRWTPLFFLDDAVALAAGHRPCGFCRRADYLAYKAAVGTALGERLDAAALNARLHRERLRPGRGLVRAGDRLTWEAPLATLPDGTVICTPDGHCHLVRGAWLKPFGFDGWGAPRPRNEVLSARVLTPPTSVTALAHGYVPVLHPTAAIPD